MGFGGLFCFLQKEGIYKKSTKHVISFSGGKDSTALDVYKRQAMHLVGKKKRSAGGDDRDQDIR